LQKETLYGATVYVLPSTSAQNANISEPQKLRYFKKLAALVEKSKH
jgi:hypothetical protein